MSHAPGTAPAPTFFETLEPRLLLSAKPTLAPIAPQDVLGGSPLLVPLNGLNPKAQRVKIKAATNDPNVQARVISTGLSMRIQVAGYGKMTFALFNRHAPRAVKQITRLANSGFYNNVIFHRVINNFMIQTGDPTGTGSGGSRLPNFDDQFHVDLQHNSSGLLSMAKSNDDTNNSQFFITEVPTRHLDFNHTIFGKLVQGDHVREAISNVPTDGSDRPVTPVRIRKITIFQDTRNAVLMLKAPEGYNANDVGLAVTVQAVKERKNGKVKRLKTQQFTTLDVQPDTANGGPFLTDIKAISGKRNKVVKFRLTAIDVEGDAVFFDAANPTNVNYNFTIDEATGEVTVTPPKGFVGTLDLIVGVRALLGSDTQDTWDTQLVRIRITK